MSDFKADFTTFLKYPKMLNVLRARFIANLRTLNVEVSNTELLNSLIDKVSEDFIQTGIKPTGDAYITANGNYDISNYATVTVEVPEGLSLPTLNTPTISRSGDTLNISNPSTNGNFKDGYNIYNDMALIKSQTASTLSLKSLDAGVYDLKVTCFGENFIDSPQSNLIHVEVYTILYEISELTKSTSEIKVSDGSTHSSVLTPSNGWWLPEKIQLYINDELASENIYTWDMYTGKFSYVAAGDIYIVASAEEEPQLKRPDIEFSGLIINELTINDVKFAMWYDVYLNDELVETFDYVDETLLADVLATPVVKITDKFVCTITNEDYESSNTYGCIYELYVDDVLFVSEKEGI